MSDFIESEAEESDNEEVSEGSDGEGTVSKRPAKQKKKRRVMDSDDDEEDGEELDKDLDDLIDDNPEEPEEESEGEENKRKHDESDLEEDLSDEDFDLIEENLGIKVNRKHKRKRIKIISDDEDSDRDEQEPADEREQLQKELFDDMEEEEDEVRHEEEKQPEDQFGDLEGSEESDVDDFIVDEEGQPISKVKKKKHIIHDDAALQEAQDIFGVDFDFDEFDQYGEEYEEEEEEIDEYEEPDMEDGEAPPTARRKKTIKRRTAKSSIFDVFEPSELERGHFTDVDQEIRMADMPERFQLRRIPVCPTEEGELEEEAEWIFKMAFNTPPVSTQDWENPEGSFGGMGKRSPNTTQKIRDALNFMRNQQFEVPFIAFYRKEYVEPELNINDLWKIYQWDEKWMQLRNRKTNMVRLFEKMQNFQFDQIDPEKPLESHVRALTEEDLDAVKNVQTMEELGDVYQHFLLYYGSDIPKMKNSMKKKNKKERVEGEEGENEVDVEEDDQQETLKQATRKSGYTMCQQAGLADMARKFGLTPEQFGENLRDNYQRHEPEQDPAEPAELAGEYVSNQFRTVEDVLQGSRHMVAMQIAHDPMVRQAVRQTFNERAKIHAKPTKKGLKEIDEAHPCYTFKYLKNKPIKSIAQDQFLKLTQAEEDGLMTFSITIDSVDTESQRGIQTYFEEIKSLYHKDEFSHLVQEWNTQRSAALERALNMILYPQMIKELKNKLIEEAKEHIIKACTQKLYNWLKVAPYQVDQQLEDEDDDYDSSKGLRVMAIAYVDDWQQAAFAILVDGEGEVTDFLRLGHLLKRKNHFRADIREHKLNDLEKLKDFIAAKKPHVIGVGAESREALNVCDDVRQVVSELEQEQQMAPISVELVDNELSIIYMNSKKSESDFREYPPLLRQAVSMARRLQEPLVEFCQLCNPDEDILALKYHPLQNSVNKEDLLDALHLEFINRVNEVGVDINKCVAHPYTAPLVQFICGLGPRKGFHLLKILKQNNSRLENRTQLVTMCHMGPKVFINCAGFIKIDTNSLGESTEAYVEVLDGSRVHPETYEWARKMAVDALEYDDTADDANPAGALEEILEAPERLKDLDLDAFAEELERQGYGNKHITLYDIRAELNHRYKDLRTPYSSPTPEEKFNMLTKESPATFYIGKLIQCQVTGIATKKPRGEQLDQANPVRNDETNLWQCPFCRKNDFPELSEVWNHFDAGECHGQSVGVKTRLDNSVMGFLPCKMLSDKKVENPEDRVKIGMTLHCRIVKIDIAKFQVDLTSRTSDLMDKEGQWKLPKDLYYDQEDEDSEIKHEEEKKKQQARQTYVKRVIAHPSFHNIDYKACEKLMASMEQGEVVIRPSSKGSDHLTCTWKVADGILHHIDIREEGKENAFSLGQSLWINNEEYEDLDEIIARFVQPMSAFGRDMLNYKYYVDSEGGKREILDKMVIDEKKKAPSKIPYFFSASKQYPAKFLLSYLPRKTVKHEYVTVTPDGFRYRGHTFHSINHLVRWFKEHFRDPIPGTPQSMRTPAGGMTGNINQTPSLNLQNVDAATIQRAAAGLSSSVFNTLSQVAGQTPAGQFPAFNAAGWQQPITTPMMTPMMTATPGQAMIGTPGQPIPTGPMGTPQYQPTPRTSWNQLGNQPGGSTPSGMTPRQGGMTPRQGQGQGSGMTPRSSGNMTPRQGSGTPRSTNMTPRHSSGMTPRQDTHSAKSTPRSTPKGGAATDWAKAAEMWRKQMEKRQGNRTPGQSPMVGGSTPGGGGGTPLFDER